MRFQLHNDIVRYRERRLSCVCVCVKEAKVTRDIMAQMEE